MDSVASVNEAAPQSGSSSPSGVARAAGNRKGHKPAASIAATPALDYAEFGISGDAIPLFEEAREMFASIGRKRTDEVFACGEVLSKAREQAPSQEAFERWSKRACRLTRRGADNYIAVHRQLSGHRKLFVECSVPAAAMYTLAHAEPEVLATVVALYQAGERPTVRDVKVLVAGDVVVAGPELADVSGTDGLKALAREKSRTAIPIVINRLRAMLADVREGLEPGKKVAKGALIEKLEHPARRARAELESLAVFVEPNSLGSEWRVHPARFPHGSGWARVSAMLFTLGGRESWPDADKLGAWLASEVVPALEFAIGEKPAKAAAAHEG
jgi:hypothetical protein